jgi:hypothetical protein
MHTNSMPEAAPAYVPTDIQPSEPVQEMEGGEADVDVAWLARWRATRDGSPRFHQEKGGGSEICSASMHKGTTSLRRRWWS